MSFAWSLSGKDPPKEVVKDVFCKFPDVSPKSRNEIIFLLFSVSPVLFVIQTSTLVMLIGEFIKGKLAKAVL